MGNPTVGLVSYTTSLQLQLHTLVLVSRCYQLRLPTCFSAGKLVRNVDNVDLAHELVMINKSEKGYELIAIASPKP